MATLALEDLKVYCDAYSKPFDACIDFLRTTPIDISLIGSPEQFLRRLGKAIDSKDRVYHLGMALKLRFGESIVCRFEINYLRRPYTLMDFIIDNENTLINIDKIHPSLLNVFKEIGLKTAAESCDHVVFTEYCRSEYYQHNATFVFKHIYDYASIKSKFAPTRKLIMKKVYHDTFYLMATIHSIFEDITDLIAQYL